MKTNKIFTIAFVLLTILLTASVVSANIKNRHRYHTSLTRMDYNRAENLVEVSIQLFTHDLQPLLERRTRKNVDLEKTTNVDQLLFEYLNENFILRNADGAAKAVKWVGKELKTDIVWIYLEIPASGELEGLKLQNTIFFESLAEQTNLVIVRDGEKKADLAYKPGDKVKEIKMFKPVEKSIP